MNKVVVAMLSALAGGVASAIVVGKRATESKNKAQQMSDKHLALFLLMNRWVAVKQQGKSLKDYFERNNYRTIAIYGMNYVGERLVEELKGTEIDIKYGIDKNADSIESDIDVVTMKDDLNNVDAIVVTPIFFYDEIERELRKKVNYPILSIEDILYEV